MYYTIVDIFNERKSRVVGNMIYLKSTIPPKYERDDWFEMLEEYDLFDNWLSIYALLIENISDRGKGFGRKFLREFLKDLNDDDCLVIAIANDYDDAINTQFHGDVEKHMNALISFYEGCGFVNIGDAFGTDYGVMILDNVRGRKVIERINQNL